MNGKTTIILALIAVLLSAAAGGLFAGVYVSPSDFNGLKLEYAKFEHSQDERIDKIFITHASDMRELEKTLGETNTKLGKLEATNDAILRELGHIRREMRRR